jgi:hypothetical protein
MKFNSNVGGINGQYQVTSHIFYITTVPKEQLPKAIIAQCQSKD